MTLTLMKQNFVNEYLLDLNATQAAIRAGYSEHTARSQGQRLLTNVDVSSAIQEGYAKRAERVEIDADFVLNGFRENYLRAMQFRPVLDKDDKPIGEYVWSGQVANKALEMMGKHIGMFDQRSINMNLNVDMQTGLDAELQRKILGMGREELRAFLDFMMDSLAIQVLPIEDLKVLVTRIKAIDEGRVGVSDSGEIIEVEGRVLPSGEPK